MLFSLRYSISQTLLVNNVSEQRSIMVYTSQTYFLVIFHVETDRSGYFQMLGEV